MVNRRELGIIEGFKPQISGIPQGTRRLGGYKIDDQLTTTKHSQILLGHAEGSSIPLAIKLSLSSDPDLNHARFMEARIQNDAASRTPFVQDVVYQKVTLPYGNEKDTHEGEFSLIVSRLFPDGSLDMHIPSGGTPRSRLLESGLLTVGFALDALTIQPVIVHRDIKLSNTLVQRQGRGKLGYITDFGLALPAGETTNTILAIGTPNHMAPEQVRQSVKLDNKTDIFAATVMALNLIDQDGLFPKDMTIEEIYHILGSDSIYADYLDRRLDRSKLPTAYKDVFWYGLAPDPKDRPSSFIDVYLALQNAHRIPDRQIIDTGRKSPVATGGQVFSAEEQSATEPHLVLV